jgi:2-deoxy-D-gluconate 3-dehydrogenase
MTRLARVDHWGLAGRVAVVIGGGGGLGSAMSTGLAAAGASVIVVGRSEDVDRVAATIGGSSVRCDVSVPEELDTCLANIKIEHGRVDVLVAAQGIARPTPLVEHTDADWDATIATNLTSVFRACRTVGGWMAEDGRGKIVTIASMLAFSGGLRVAAYAASKGGLAQLTKAMANELAPYGVNVNAIAPGYVKTNANRHIWQDDPRRSEEILARLPAGRWGEPSDLVGPLLFLCSPHSDYLHGVVLPVDGGWLSR